MILEKKPHQVWVVIDEGTNLDGRYLVQEISAIELAETIDKLEKRYQDKGRATRGILVARELFVERIKEWQLKVDLDCSSENKRAMYEKFASFSNRLLVTAELLIDQEKEKELGNLPGGAPGI